MADFFSDIFGGLLGQQEVPERQTLSTSDLMGQIGTQLPGLANQNVDYAQMVGPGLQRVASEMEGIYDPQQRGLREATTQKILSELNLGGQLPADVRDAVLQSGLERAGAAGIGGAGLGRNLVARDLGLTSLDLLRQRIGTAAGYTRSGPQFNPPMAGMTPSDIGNVIMGNVNQANDAAQYESGINAQNRANLIERPLNLAAGAAGSFFGFGGIGKGAGGIMNLAKGAGGAGTMTSLPMGAGGFSDTSSLTSGWNV